MGEVLFSFSRAGIQLLYSPNYLQLRRWKRLKAELVSHHRFFPENFLSMPRTITGI
jgi:hypothetical protein